MNENKWQTTFLMAWHTLPYPYVHRVMLWRAIEFNCFDTLIFVQAKQSQHRAARCEVDVFMSCSSDIWSQFSICHHSSEFTQSSTKMALKLCCALVRLLCSCVEKFSTTQMIVQCGSLFCFSRSPDVTHIFWAISNRKTNRNKNPFFVWKQCALNLSSYT